MPPNLRSGQCFIDISLNAVDIHNSILIFFSKLILICLYSCKNLISVICHVAKTLNR